MSIQENVTTRVNRGQTNNKVIVAPVRTTNDQKAIDHCGLNDLKVVSVFNTFKSMLSQMLHHLFGDRPV